jgi:phosphoserine aminotransferase
MLGLVLEWLQSKGGVEGMEKIKHAKAKLLYDYLDASALFNPTVMGEDRSIMNVPFVTGNPDLDAAFVKQATAAGLVNLKGHRSVGGMRASIYNAMDMAGVEKLVNFMKDFEQANK